MYSTEVLIEKIIKPSLEKANLSLPNFSIADGLEKIILYGAEGAALDSLNLVGFIFILEEEILAFTKTEIKFSVDDILNKELVPFLNVNNLAAFLQKKLSAI